MDVTARSDPADFDAELGLDTNQLFAFLQATQPEQLSRLTQRAYGRDTTRMQIGLASRLARELDARRTVDVLRSGITDHGGMVIRLAYFKPAHGLTQGLVDLFESNRLTVSRQFAYESSSNKTLDLVSVGKRHPNRDR